MKHLWVLLVCAPFLKYSFSQDKVLMLNGKEIKTKIIDTTFLNVTIQNKPGQKPIDIERYRIFSINWDGNEIVLYKQDTLIGNLYSEHEMRMFVYGEKDALEHFRTPYTFVGGVATGVLGGFIQPLIIAKTLSSENVLARPLFTPLLPLTYCFVVGTRWIKIDKKDVSNSIYLSEETYVEGFDREARGKRVQRAIWGSLTGLIAGLTLSFVTAGN